jgi:hypothetical protein
LELFYDVRPSTSGRDHSEGGPRARQFDHLAQLDAQTASAGRIFEDAISQYVLLDGGEVVRGVWYIPPDAGLPLIVDARPW